MPLGTKPDFSFTEPDDLLRNLADSVTGSLFPSAGDLLILGDSRNVMMDINKTLISFCQPKPLALRQRSLQGFVPFGGGGQVSLCTLRPLHRWANITEDYNVED